MTRRRRRWTTIAGALAIAAAVGGVVVASGDGETRPRVTAGSTVLLTKAQVGGFTSVVQVRQPWGTLLIGIAFADDTTGRRAPDGGRFVRLAVTQSPAPIDLFYLPSTTATVDRDTLPVARIDVVDGSRTYPVRFTGRKARYVLSGVEPLFDPEVPVSDKGLAAAVALPDRSNSVRVRIEYDGVVQTVAPTPLTPRPVPAALAQLRAEVGSRTVTTQPTWSGGVLAPRSATSLQVSQTQRTPYLLGRGWAPPGRTWWTAALAARAPGRVRATPGSYTLGEPSRESGYRVVGGTVVSTHAGLSRLGGRSGLPDVGGERVAVLVPESARTVAVTVRFPARARGSAPPTDVVTATWAVPLG